MSGFQTYDIKYYKIDAACDCLLLTGKNADMLSKRSIKPNIVTVLEVLSRTVTFFTLMLGSTLSSMPLDAGKWSLTAILGYPVCFLRLRGPLLYEIFPFSSIHHSDRSFAMTPLSYFYSGSN